MTRVLIVDDEAPARARLRQILTLHSGIEIVGEAESGTQAMELAAALKPDLLLLDIQMPGCSGVDVAASLRHPRPHIIFCTAHDQHAVDAFELHAVDYLLKPVSRTRLAAALDRVRSLGPGDGDTVLDTAARSQRGPAVRFLVRNASHYLVVGQNQVLYFLSDGGLTKLVADGAQYWMDPSLNELEQRVDPARFCRVSRAAMVNLNAVAEVHSLPGGSGEALLKNGERIEVSRRRFRHLLDSLQGNA
jgi:two-component system LytT family response regulator